MLKITLANSIGSGNGHRQDTLSLVEMVINKQKHTRVVLEDTLSHSPTLPLSHAHSLTLSHSHTRTLSHSLGVRVVIGKQKKRTRVMGVQLVQLSSARLL